MTFSSVHAWGTMLQTNDCLLGALQVSAPTTSLLIPDAALTAVILPSQPWPRTRQTE